MVPTKAPRSSKTFQPTKAWSKSVSFSKVHIPHKFSQSGISTRLTYALCHFWNNSPYTNRNYVRATFWCWRVDKTSQPPQRFPHRFRRWCHMLFHWCQWYFGGLGIPANQGSRCEPASSADLWLLHTVINDCWKTHTPNKGSSFIWGNSWLLAISMAKDRGGWSCISLFFF